MRLGGLITLLALAALAAPAHAQDVGVRIGSNAFSPAEVRIVEGQVVNWFWVGPDKNHSTTTTAEGQTTWDSHPGQLTPSGPPDGEQFSKEFAYAGTYDYFCKTHDFMRGRIIVEDRINNPNPPPGDTAAPRLGTMRIAVARRQVRFRLNEDARVEGKLRGPVRRTLKRNGRAGVNTIRLPRRLKRGRYAVVLRATDAAGNRSTTVRKKFRVR